MSISWLENGGAQPSTRNTLAGLVKSIVDPESPHDGLEKVIDLAGRLILSNHLHEANELLYATYNFAAKTGDDRVTSGVCYGASLYQVFWHLHPELKRPDSIPELSFALLEHDRWGKYRECTRTGWMSDAYGVAEPDDPSIWRETEDAAMIALCARLLAKTTVPETYPPPERMREALDATLKLYAQSQPSSYITGLVYRRLAIELALRLGEFRTAADVLSTALTLDGLSESGSIWHYLLLPGIYDALPLLAEGGKESNMFFIPKEDAKVIETEVLAALQLRLDKGRQWELAEHRVGWGELLNRLAEAAWKTHRAEYRFGGCQSAKDILYPPATEEEIQQAEEKVGELPLDFKAMVRIANGFKGGHHLFGGGIAGIQNITYDDGDCNLENIADEFEDVGLRQDGDITGTVIQLEPGVEADLYNHYIIPPAMWKANVVDREVVDGEYQYWNLAPWEMTTWRYNTIRDYVASCVEKVEAMAARGEVANFHHVDFPDGITEDASSESN